MRPSVAIGALGVVVVVGLGLIVMDMAKIRGVRNSDAPADIGRGSVAVVTEDAAGVETVVRVEPVGVQDSAAALSRIADFDKRWVDALSLASSTARIQLAGPVKDLQALSREASAMELTSCLEPGRESWVASLDASVSVFLAFMAQEQWKQADLLSLSEREARNWRMIKDACR